MAATVPSFTEGRNKRTVVILSESKGTPKCCSYQKTGTGIPCIHGIDVLSEKYGTSNLHKFVDERHLNSTWKEQYQNLTISLHSPNDFDSVMILEKRAAVADDNVNIPKAILPPNGIPVHGTGKRRN